MRDYKQITGWPPHQSTLVAVDSKACWGLCDCETMHQHLAGILVKIQYSCSWRQNLRVSARLPTGTWQSSSSRYISWSSQISLLVSAENSKVCWSLRDTAKPAGLCGTQERLLVSARLRTGTWQASSSGQLDGMSRQSMVLVSSLDSAEGTK